jgi:hypothetical protein
MFQHLYKTSAFTFKGRYLSKIFYSIILDTRAARILTAGEPQL